MSSVEPDELPVGHIKIQRQEFINRQRLQIELVKFVFNYFVSRNVSATTENDQVLNWIFKNFELAFGDWADASREQILSLNFNNFLGEPSLIIEAMIKEGFLPGSMNVEDFLENLYLQGVEQQFKIPSAQDDLETKSGVRVIDPEVMAELLAWLEATGS